jgi:hypothetical protein
MADQDVIQTLGKLTSDMNAIALVVSHLVAAHCRNTPAPLSEIDYISRKMQPFLDAADPGTDAQATQMANWLRERVSLIVSYARREI